MQIIKASILLGTWLKLSLEGEESVRSSMTKATFYRHRKELIESNCNWNNNLIEKDDSEKYFYFLSYRYKQILL